MGFLTNVVFFTSKLVFTIVIFLLWARVALRYFRISALNPISQNIYALTNPLVHPIENILPQKFQSNKYDWPCLITLVLIEFIKCFVLVLLAFKQVPPFFFLIIYTLVDLIIQPLNLLFYAIIIRVIISWVNPGWRHPAAEVIYLITEPVLVLGRKIIPPIKGFDFSPLVILLVIQLISMFFVNLLPIKSVL